ncbi:MAG: hypothetical protein KIT31_31830 [Deltaproteobacteria bacterium]|nr:hypothetical protein [Deltaproteobacteria bacterium]
MAVASLDATVRVRRELDAVLGPLVDSSSSSDRFEATFRSMQEQYAEEARDEAWAREREDAILAYTQRDILDLDRDARVELDCRTSACRIRIWSEDPHLVDILGDYPFPCMARWGTADLGQVSEGRRYADVYILFDDELRDGTGFVTSRDNTCPRYRDEWLRYTRQPIE